MCYEEAEAQAGVVNVEMQYCDDMKITGENVCIALTGNISGWG
jgi:hypothetical protein